MRDSRTPPEDERPRSGALHLLLSALFWIVVAVALFFYFKSTK